MSPTLPGSVLRRLSSMLRNALPALRSVASAVLITVACALVPVVTFLFWAQHEIGDTDAYVATMAPLASDSAVQDDVVDAVTEAIMTRVDREDHGARGSPGGSRPLRGSVKTFVSDAVRSFTGTRAFQAAWDAANRATHDAVIHDLSRGHDGGVGFDIAPISAHVKQQLVQDAVPFANRIPVEHTDVTVLEAGDLTVTRKGFHVLQVMGVWLPVASMLFAVGGILLAVRRRRAVTATAAGMALGAGVLLAAIAAVRGLALGDLPPDVSRASAGAVFDALTRTLWLTAWMIFATGACVVLLTWLGRRRTIPSGGRSARHGVAEREPAT
jgi:hypothetical protein